MKKLLAVDGSDHAQQALRETIGRVRETGDDLEVAIYVSDESDMTLADVETKVRSIIDATDRDIPCHRLETHPGSELVEMADGTDYEQLLIGVQTTTPLGKVQLGHVAEFVILNAETTVTLVRSLSTEASQSIETNPTETGTGTST